MDTTSLEYETLQKLIPECKALAQEFNLSLTELILMRILLLQNWTNNNIVELHKKFQ